MTLNLAAQIALAQRAAQQAHIGSSLDAKPNTVKEAPIGGGATAPSGGANSALLEPSPVAPISTIPSPVAPTTPADITAPDATLLEQGDYPMNQSDGSTQTNSSTQTDQPNPILAILRDKLEAVIAQSSGSDGSDGVDDSPAASPTIAPTLDQSLWQSANSLVEILATIKALPNVPDVFINECIDLALPVLKAQKEQYVLDLLSGAKKKRQSTSKSVLPSILIAADALSGQTEAKKAVNALDLTIDKSVMDSLMGGLASPSGSID